MDSQSGMSWMTISFSKSVIYLVLKKLLSINSQHMSKLSCSTMKDNLHTVTHKTFSEARLSAFPRRKHYSTSI